MSKQIIKFAKALIKSELVQNEEAELPALIGVLILAAIIIVLYSILGPALVAPGITAMSNTSAITGYSTWQTGTQNMWTATPTLTGLTWLFVPVVLLMAMVKYI